MKRFINIFCILTVAVTTFATNENFVQVSKTNPKYFELKSGEPFIPNGLNLCFPRWQDDEDKAWAGVESQFAELSKNHANFIRVWLSNKFYEVETAEGVFDQKKFDRIDKLLELAKKYNIRIKFCFEHFREILPKDAKTFFNKSIYHKSQGGSFTSMVEFFTSPKGKEVFLNRVNEFAKRYSNNPNVFAWELWNEVNAVKTPMDIYKKWTEEMLAQTRKMFPNHMVVQSLGSFDSDYALKSYSTVIPVKNNDFAQVHRYLDLGAKWTDCQEPMDLLTSSAVNEVKKIVKDSPIILAETGAVQPNHSGPFELYPKDKDGILLHDAIFAPFFSGTAGSGQFWHWDVYVQKNNLWAHFDKFAEAIKSINPIEENFEPVRIDNKQCRIYALKGKNVILAWVRDSNSNWITELRDGKTPDTVKNSRLRFDSLVDDDVKRVEFYDPWTGEKRNVVMQGRSCVLPEFKRSCIIKLVL